MHNDDQIYELQHRVAILEQYIQDVVDLQIVKLHKAVAGCLCLFGAMAALAAMLILVAVA